MISTGVIQMRPVFFGEISLQCKGMVNLKDFPCNNRALVWVGYIDFRYLNWRDSKTYISCYGHGLREFSQP